MGWQSSPTPAKFDGVLADLKVRSATAPIGSEERIGELDVLRGFALLGVFVVHFASSSLNMLSVDEATREAILSRPLDFWALLLTELAFYDKANTLFAALFGMGFWVMMERLQARGVPFQSIYLRRLLTLLTFGAFNVVLIFPADVLHIYALLGLVLLVLRGLPKPIMLVAGLLLTVFGYSVGTVLVPGADAAWEQFDIVQTAAFERGKYGNWVATTARAFFLRDFFYGGAFAWALYLFGRFLMGAWIMRAGWMGRLGELVPQLRRMAWITLPLGLTLGIVRLTISWGYLAGTKEFADLLHFISVPLQAVGYALVLILLFHSRWKRIALVFAPVGRMALTAYIVHGAVFTAVYMPFGFGMRGIMGPAASLAFVLALYVLIALACHWWLARYRYGPLEYLWRWATYGNKPKFRLASSPAAV